MATIAPVGSDVQAGTYRCTNCGNELSVQSVTSLPPCSKCDGPYGWEAITGGDSVKDPYPDKN
jgi:Zinc-ribbon containing domain